MRKSIVSFGLALLSLSFFACSNNKDSKKTTSETASSIAAKWCDLNAQVEKAEGEAKDAAKKALNDYENEMEAKYKKDEAFMKQIETEAEKCEEAR